MIKEKVIQYICDRCGKTFKMRRSGKGVCEINSDDQVTHQFDLCLDCQDSLWLWFNEFKPSFQEVKLHAPWLLIDTSCSYWEKNITSKG